ncbi:FAD-dependent oxidoreductase [Mycetocola sp. 2940]|uniref:NAD(P)/FAD-dependent oxidoreductase n=1 Tax=Mycetocola sp. 2940 TaxID=3156452 RepID=UPI003398B12F
MSEAEKFMIVGAGLTGATAAKTLREEGFQGRIQLVGRERHKPYIRPPLSKEFLAGSATRESADVEEAEWYRDHDVDLLLGTDAVAIDPSAHRVELAGRGPVGYDTLLLATGSTPRRLDLPGADLPEVHYLRTVDQADTLRSLLADGDKRLVLVGSGWIGMEVASVARTLGNDVTVLERDPIPLANALGDELGQMFADLHTEHGVRLRPSVQVAGITGQNGHVSGVRLDDGETVPADLVLIGVGALPNVELAQAAGLAVDNGVLVDASLRSSDPHIYAAGDIANAMHPRIGLRLRSEHWANALHGGAAAARSMLGQPVSYDGVPYFYTDQFDLGMEYSGYGPLTRGATVVYRGDRQRRTFISFWVAENRVVAGMNVNVWDVNEAVQGIIRRGNPVDAARLADETVPLEEL